MVNVNIMKITEFMHDNHRIMNEIFKHYRTSKPKNKNVAKCLFMQYKIELQKHIAWEEKLLFNLFEERTGIRENGPTQEMREEHKQIKKMLAQIHNKLAENKLNTIELEHKLMEIIRDHMRKEEQILYPWIDNAFGEDKKEFIFKKIQILNGKYNKCCE